MTHVGEKIHVEITPLGMRSRIKTLTIQNDLMRVEILPEFGGKITSIRSLRTGGEFILPALKDHRRVAHAAKFSENDGGGFDECLPSVAACESVDSGPAVPDHGDLWRAVWHIDSQKDEIVLHADAQSRSLRLTRRATLNGPSLLLEYDLYNFSDTPTNWLWSAHPLLQVDAGDHVVLPGDIDQVTVEYSATGLFETGRTIPWRNVRLAPDAMTDLSRVKEKDGITAYKLFAQMNSLGWAALYRNKLKQGLAIRFDSSALPYLGIWLCYGSWPETGVQKQYTVALEPTTSNVDSLVLAQRNKTARRLGAREHCRWILEIELLGASAPITLDDCRNNC